MHPPLKKVRAAMGGIVGYLALWGATALLAPAAVEDALVDRYGKGVQVVGRVTEDSRLALAVDCDAIAPFLVRAESRYAGFLWCGEGAQWVLFSVPGRAWVLRKHVRWFA